MERAKEKVIVLDTSAFIAGFDPFSIGERQYTVPTVAKELSETFLEEVKASATTVGDAFFLSETDQQVLALALELKTQGFFPLIATDDYSIQNVAKQLGIEFTSLITFGIRRRLEWIRYCPACHKKYPANYKSQVCEICGTKLKRKPLKTNHPK
jgi:UPF0271 protein